MHVVVTDDGGQKRVRTAIRHSLRPARRPGRGRGRGACQSRERSALAGGVEEVAPSDLPTSRVIDVDRAEAGGTAGRYSDHFGTRLPAGASSDQPGADRGDHRSDVCTSHQSRLGPVTASNASRDTNGAMPVTA